jgi:NADPH:quinone reductase-like Zn-dependent oxidoreductase
MSKVVRFHQTGGPEVLQIDDLPPTEPGQGEVRLKVQALGLNRAECMFRSGMYLETPALPSRLGYEAAGTVQALLGGVPRVGSLAGYRVKQPFKWPVCGNDERQQLADSVSSRRRP